MNLVASPQVSHPEGVEALEAIFALFFASTSRWKVPSKYSVAYDKGRPTKRRSAHKSVIEHSDIPTRF